MKAEKLYEKLDDYKRASSRLDEATKLDAFNDIIMDGVIQRFEFTFELSWKLMKIYLEYMGIDELNNPRAVIREAFANGLIDDGEQWIDMMVDRNKPSHLYDEEEVRFIYEKIKIRHNPILLRFTDEIEYKINEIE